MTGSGLYHLWKWWWLGDGWWHCFTHITQERWVNSHSLWNMNGSPRTSVFLPRASPGVSWGFDHRDVQGGALGSCCSSSWAETLPLPLGARGNWRESPSENKVPMEKTENFRILHLYVELIWELIRFWNLVLVRTMIVTICNYGFPKWYD